MPFQCPFDFLDFVNGVLLFGYFLYYYAHEFFLFTAFPLFLGQTRVGLIAQFLLDENEALFYHTQWPVGVVRAFEVFTPGKC